jgi:hypothetical protein
MTSPGFVYFVRPLPHERAQAIKIGYSRIWQERVRLVMPFDHVTYSGRRHLPDVLRVISGDQGLERRTHAAFAVHRLDFREQDAEGWIYSELFRPVQEVLDHIAALAPWDVR